MNFTYNNQSTASIFETSSGGRPSAVSTMIIMMIPACGTLAAPIDARVAVKLSLIVLGIKYS